MEVIHEGVLEIGVKPDSKSSKDWKTRLFVLKRCQQAERATLDYYKNTNKRWQKQSIKGVLSLWPKFEISIAHLCSYKFTLKLTTIERTVYLAAPSPAAMNKWYYFIQTQHVLTPTEDMYIFNVQARDSDTMNLIGAVGDCQLVLTPEYQVKVVNLPKKEVLCVWPFDCLKTFSYGGGLFSFTAGRHSPHGPGDYSFITSQDKVIHHQLQKLIDKAKRYSTTSSEASSFLSISDRPPAKLPLTNHRGGREESSSDTPTSSSDENMPPPPDYAVARDFSSHRPPLPDGPPPKIPPKPPSAISPPTSSNKTWLQERYGSQLDNKGRIEEGLDEDHVYSHTVHQGCNKHKSPPVEEDPNIYNALVHQGLSKKPSINSYDLAYPKAKTQTVKGGSDTYSFIEQDKREENDSNIKPPTNSPPLVLPLSPDGMTANPLYGSSGNLLEAIDANPLSSNKEDSITKPLPPNEPLPRNDTKPLPSDEEPVLPNDSGPLPLNKPIVEPLPSNPISYDNNNQIIVDNNKSPRPDVTANPTYVITNINNNTKTHNPLSSNEQSSQQQDTSSNTKGSSGYSKINKPTVSTNTTNTSNVIVGSPDFVASSSVSSDFVPSSVGSDPPPIPEREYSFSDLEQCSPPV